MKKYRYVFFSSQNRLENAAKGGEEDKIKIIVTFRSYLTRNLKFQKNSNKIQKVKKHHYGFFSSQKRFEKAEKGRK